MSRRPTQLSSPLISSVVKPAKPRPFCSLEWAAMNCSPVIGNTLRTIGERLISAFRLYYVGCCNEQLRISPACGVLPSREQFVCSRRCAVVPSFLRRIASLRIALIRSEEHTSELQSLTNLVCRLLLEKKKKNKIRYHM